MHLLLEYGITTVFGIPGVHSLDFCNGLSNNSEEGHLRHVQTRNEQGAGFMAEGWARATGRPGVAVVISGPGVTNSATALGQCFADSLPFLLISAEPSSDTIGKGRGVLHEITEQKLVTTPLTAFSATARQPEDVPDLLAQAFAVFSGARPRPVHISIPIDVMAKPVAKRWGALQAPKRNAPRADIIAQAARLLANATDPAIMVGGGAIEASSVLIQLAEKLGAPVICSTAGKGIIPDSHPLCLSASTVRPEIQNYLREPDVILAIGTELSETDSFVERLSLTGRIIRIDIDPAKMNDMYPAELAIVADSLLAVQAILAELDLHKVVSRFETTTSRVKALRAEIVKNLSAAERRHSVLLMAIRDSAPRETVFSGDACQLVYTGAFMMPIDQPRKWFYPAGYCALGNALPNGIGASLALPNTPVAVLVGDGGFMFTMPELVTAAELKLPLPIVIWENGGLKQIQDDMDARKIKRVGVEGINPDFFTLAQACHCDAVVPNSINEFKVKLSAAFSAQRPTLIVVKETAEWLI